MLLPLLAFAFALVAARAQSPPPLGPLAQFSPISNQNLGFRHCTYQGSFCPIEAENEDFQFVLVKGLTGVAGTYSIQSVNFPDHYLGLFNSTSGLCGILALADASADDLTWSLVAPLVPAGNLTGVVSLVSQTKVPAFSGKYLTAAPTNNAVCAYAPPSGDAVLASPNGAASTFHLGPAGPKPPAAISVNALVVTNAAVNKNIMGW